MKKGAFFVVGRYRERPPCLLLICADSVNPLPPLAGRGAGVAVYLLAARPRAAGGTLENRISADAGASPRTREREETDSIVR